MQVYQENITSKRLLIKNLTPGKSYRFIVQSRNEVGLSRASEILSALAAQAPNPPQNLANLEDTTSGTVIGVTWDYPDFDGGS